ncbi:GNAT family N-acetyltransferase [Brevibacillus ruminantium]|uniref:GNAT family N-acetyltransferase n=1 Tax=Brevibacillus ruminantium TaxID=2950604 RepID=A0ABY4WNC2_9BACL|nr:GNAT family N-acetyltransferase [Brevibacillus ruminantium]USG67330.1 GNAT family N-acetyltransferase [Brevibacillus ruminantium]
MEVQTEQQLQDALSVRHDVFIKEQQVPQEIEIDEHDRIGSGTLHFVVYRGGVAVGAGRLRPYSPGISKVERVAIAKSERGTGLGRLLMLYMEETAKRQRNKGLKLNAQTHAQPFYEKLGYTPIGSVFVEAGIEHIAMEKSWTS